MTTSTTSTPVNLSMSAIRKALPAYFMANTPGLVSAYGDAKANIGLLALALTGAALEVGQSGNRPASWIDTDANAQKLKGDKKARVNSALSLVMSVKPASVKSADIGTYEGMAAAVHADIFAALTPPAPAAKDPAKESSSVKISRLEAELSAMTIERDAIKAAFEAFKKEHAPVPA